MSGRPRAAKSAARSKSASVQKPKPAAARPKQPAKKPAARAAPAPAAAAPAAPERVLPWHAVTTAQRKAPRTLETWREQKHNAAFFCDYQFTIKDEETDEKVSVFRSAFSVKDRVSRGGLRTLEAAFDFGQRAYLSRVKDGSEVWSDPDALALYEPSRDLIRNPEEPQNNRYQRNFRPGDRMEVNSSGDLKVVSYQRIDGKPIYKSRLIDEAKLDSLQDRLRGEDAFMVDCVLNFAADVDSMEPDEQRELLFDRAWALRLENEAAALLRRENYERHVDENMGVLVEEFDEDIGLTQEVKDHLSQRDGKEVKTFLDLDDCPLACLLGSADHCPIYPKIMKCFYRSKRRNATRGVQGRVPLLVTFRETTICC